MWLRRLKSALPARTASGESPDLRALCGPIDEALLPLGFTRTSTTDKAGFLVAGVWVSPAAYVSASFEGREPQGFVTVGRRRDDIPEGHRSMSSLVYLDELLEARGITAGAPLSSAWKGRRPADIQGWATVGAADLMRLPDVLRGEGLDLVDTLIGARDPWSYSVTHLGPGQWKGTARHPDGRVVECPGKDRDSVLSDLKHAARATGSAHRPGLSGDVGERRTTEANGQP